MIQTKKNDNKIISKEEIDFIIEQLIEAYGEEFTEFIERENYKNKKDNLLKK